MQRCTRENIVINTFMLESNHQLVQFVDEMTRLNRGRAFFISPDRLGDYVLVDYVAQQAPPRRLSVAGDSPGDRAAFAERLRLQLASRYSDISVDIDPARFALRVHRPGLDVDPAAGHAAPTPASASPRAPPR